MSNSTDVYLGIKNKLLLKNRKETDENCLSIFQKVNIYFLNKNLKLMIF